MSVIEDKDKKVDWGGDAAAGLTDAETVPSVTSKQ